MDQLVGKTVEEASALLGGAKVRPVEIDGKGLMVTKDHNPDRVNVAVANGKIVRFVNKG
jgi:hypothetical protein